MLTIFIINILHHYKSTTRVFSTPVWPRNVQSVKTLHTGVYFLQLQMPDVNPDLASAVELFQYCKKNEKKKPPEAPTPPCCLSLAISQRLV